MKKTKKMQVNRRVTKTANFILGSEVVEVGTVDDYGNCLSAKVVNPKTNEVLWIDFDEDDYLASGFRFYSPLKRSEQETLELLQYSQQVDFSENETRNLEKALHDWAFKWKTGGLTGSGYTRPKCGGNTRHRRCYRLKVEEYEKQHTYSYLFYDEEGEVHEMH